MSELRRMRDEGDSFERALLASARGDRMSSDAKRALVAAVSVGAVGAVSVQAASTKAALSVASQQGTLVGATLGKWAAIVTVGSALFVAAGLPLVRPEREPMRAREIVPAQAARAMVVHRRPALVAPLAPAPTENVVGAELSAPVPESSALSALPALPTRPKPPKVSAATQKAATTTKAGKAQTTPQTSSDSASLAEEVALIERARASLAAHRSRDALAALEEHRARFPAGRLGVEASVLRIDAHARAGDVAIARSLAHAFLSAHGGSPYAPRVHGILDALDRKSAP